VFTCGSGMTAAVGWLANEIIRLEEGSKVKTSIYDEVGDVREPPSSLADTAELDGVRQSRREQDRQGVTELRSLPFRHIIMHICPDVAPRLGPRLLQR
jgi:hypothetical protein